MSSSDGATYAPVPRPQPVVSEGEFPFAVMHLDHGHIFGMTEGLIGAGGTLTWVYDPIPERAAAFKEKFPQVRLRITDNFGAVLSEAMMTGRLDLAILYDRGPSPACRIALRYAAE